MTGSRWRQIEDLFQRAMDLPPGARREFLDSQDGVEASVIEEAARLIAASSSADRIFEDRAWMGALLDKTQDPRVGTILGAWRLRKPLGGGGMGTVYLAERADEQFHKQAALKIVRLGLDSEAMLRRFRRERQILASLEHPNIARLLDGGVTGDGYPYLVMEYIEGERLDQYCQSRRLSARETVCLFRRICASVRYLHRNLILHCDLKPSNVIVTPEGEPVLLDFGIARWADEAGAGNQTSTAFIFTPRFASPEQVAGLPLTTQCDVYSLGVILFEMLTGQSPYGATERSPTDWMRAVESMEPPLPSRVPSASIAAADLKGDLDRILLAAMRKDRTERYGSVEALDEDLRRYLEGLPVQAGPQTVAYRLRKFAARHRAGVAGSAAVFLALVGGLATTLYEARVAARERDRAERRFDDVRGLARLILFEFHDGVMNLPGSTGLQRELIEKTLAHLESIAADAREDTKLMTELAGSYLRLGNLQGNPYYPNLGEAPRSLATYDRGLRLLAAVPEGTGPVPLEQSRALLWRARSEVAAMTSNDQTSLDDLKHALRLLEALVRREPANPGLLSELGSSYESFASYYTGTLTGRVDLALARKYYALAGEQYRKALALQPDSVRARRALAINGWRRGELEQQEGDARAALASLSRASSALEALPAAERDSLPNQRLAAVILRAEGEALAATGQFPDALERFARSEAMQQRLLDSDPDNRQFQMSMATLLHARGLVYESGGEPGRALEDFSKAGRYLRVIETADVGNKTVRDKLAELDLLRARLLNAANQTGAAFAAARSALRVRREIAARKDSGPEDWVRYADALWDVQPAALRDRAAAVRYYQKARDAGAALSPVIAGRIGAGTR